MAAKSNFRNMVLCLFGVCLVCSAVLGLVFVTTEEPIAKVNEQILKQSIGEVLPEGGEISGMKTADGVEYYENTVDGVVVAYAVKSKTAGFGGPLSLMVGVLPDGTVVNTSVLSHSETPGLGAKCTTDAAFMNQWKGFDGKLAVTKDGGDVDAITASTITSRAYTKAVAAAVDFVRGLAPQTAAQEPNMEGQNNE